MSDQKLRDLERRWKETGTVEDEAAYLLERVRVGDLSRDRLELAAYCGHEGARRAVGTDPTVPSQDSTTIEWIRTTPATKPLLRSEFIWRACIAAVEATSREWDEHLGSTERIGGGWDQLRAAAEEIVSGWTGGPSHLTAMASIGACERLGSTERVRTAVRSALVRWLLS